MEYTLREHNEREQEASYGKLWENFKKNTTVHGVPHVTAAKGMDK